MNSICIRCGTFKSDFQGQCASCDFTPEEDVDIAKSRILSFPYTFTYGQDGDTIETGRTRFELEAISHDIKNGKPYEFPNEELRAILTVWQEFQNVTLRQLVMDAVKWAAPVVVVLMLVVLWVLKVGQNA